MLLNRFMIGQIPIDIDFASCALNSSYISFIWLFPNALFSVLTYATFCTGNLPWCSVLFRLSELFFYFHIPLHCWISYIKKKNWWQKTDVKIPPVAQTCCKYSSGYVLPNTDKSTNFPYVLMLATKKDRKEVTYQLLLLVRSVSLLLLDDTS